MKDVETLQRNLVALRLAERRQVDGVVAKLATPSVDDVLGALEAADILTPFVVSRIRKGETKGLVLGDYRLLYRNASGSFARVYRAKSLKDGSMVGVKVLRQRWAEDPANVCQFREEAELGRKLRHPNITPIYDIGQTDGFYWFGMEFVVGGNLRDFIRIRGTVEPVEAVRHLLGMARGLDYALGMGYTHRDLKMTNVLMSSAGDVKLIDFGLAGQGESFTSAHSRAIEYAAIETATGAPPNDPRSDLFFLGAILYELLTGTPPYPRTRDRDERADVARYRNVRPIRQAAPNLPMRVVELVDRLMKIEPNQRFQRPAEVVAEAEATLTDLGEDVPSLTGPNSNVRTPGADGEKPSILCVEDRVKHLDMMREYFTKHGYRVLAMSDVNRAIDRIDRNPPDCVVLMGGSIGTGIVEAFSKAVSRAGMARTAVVAVLSESQGDLEAKLTASDRHPVLARVATLRDLRKSVESAISVANGDGR